MTTFDDTLTNTRLNSLHNKEEEQLVRALAPQYGFQYVNLHETPIDPDALKLLNEVDARRDGIAIFARGNKDLSIAIKNPKTPEINSFLEKITALGLSPIFFLASQGSIELAWSRYHDMKKSVLQKQGVLDVDPETIKRFAAEIQTTSDVSEKVFALQNENGVARISQTIGVIFGGALSLNASDVHIEPEAAIVRVRYRLDGVLAEICSLQKETAAHIVSRLKLLSGLKLNVRKEAQDGRFTFTVGTRQVEVRSSVIPGSYGESMVMRLLDPDSSSFKLENLGLNAKLHDTVVAELHRPNGAIITTGPTGSGKTTALYSFLLSIHTPEIKIITLEDPVEYKLPGIVQTQVTETYTFEEGLRSILRQDPDVILIGEIRDREVAETAIHAALTGHLVFSTLHTNSAAAAFARLIDLGVDSRMIGSACNLILGQRLVRILCPHCKKERDITTEEQKLIQGILKTPLAIHTIFDAVGCDACGGSGYHGRIGVFEAIRVDDALEEAILMDTRESAIQEAAKSQGIPTMQEDGIFKVLAGVTTLDEVSRVLDLYNNISE
ncbi:MAG: type II/IV secretion system protein [Candidatus Pacebacteria bacterium]|nr:type II/IV secretion system protein [Candidatus Paceibacterota bacterium]MCF7857653.1 type II/IV secretion system protein [Candidatus Paceibacterota bacterium]